MKWTVAIHTQKYTDYDEKTVQVKDDVKTFECPFKFHQDVYYVYPEHRLFKKDRWVIRKSIITEVWATNIFGVALDGGHHIHEDLFYRLFINKEEAIEFCLKKNQQSKVKIYNE